MISYIHLHPNSTLMDYMGSQALLLMFYIQNKDGSFLQEFIYHGHAFLLVDGLDEVSNYDERTMIIKLIDEFVEKYVRTPIHISVNDQKNTIDEWGNMNCEQPTFVGGNQVIITSRSIGYYLYPIQLAMLETFTLKVMNKSQSQTFIDYWLLHYPRQSIQCNRIIRKNKESQIKELFSQLNENILSHPMLLSMILPILYGTTIDIDQLQNRFRLIELTVQFALRRFIIEFESSLDDETIYYLLRDMATYIHLYSPSGLIDTFDMTNLLTISLTKLYKHKKIRKTKECLREYVCKFVSLLTSHSTGFVAARGLDAYGFSHLIFQEYFVSLQIVDSHNECTDTSVIDCLLMLTTKPRFHEPLTLTMEWISLNWQSNRFDTFCLQLLEKAVGPYRTGALFLSSVLMHLTNVPGLHILSCLFNVLMDSLVHTNNVLFLTGGLIEAKVISRLIEYFLKDNTNTTRICRFFVISLVERKHTTFELPGWLSKNDFLKLESSVDTCEIHMTTVDSIFYYMSNNEYPYDALQLSNDLIQILKTKTSIIYPTILSVLIILCGGLHDYQCSAISYDTVSKPIQFDATRMHRSTPIADLLLTYFTDQNLPYLIKQCHEIVISASVDDVSRRVVDAFVVLICLQGVHKLTLYKDVLKYCALPRALYRMRLALYQTRQFYRTEPRYAWQPGPLPLTTKPSKIEGCHILEKLIVKSEIDISTISSFSIAMSAAFTHLFFHESTTNVLWNQPLPISLSENERLLQNIRTISVEMLYQLLNLSSENKLDPEIQWNKKLRVFQLYHQHPLFPVAFISSKLRPVYERLISKQQLKQNEEIISYTMIVLTEVLRSLDEICYEQSSKVSLILHVLEDDIRKYQLGNYMIAIMYDMKNETNIKSILHEERKRAHPKSDMELFTTSIGLLRLTKSLNNTYDEIFEEIIELALSISDPVLQILCLRHMKEIVRSCVDTKFYRDLQAKITITLEEISIDDKSLIILTLILSTCIEEQLHSSMKRLINLIWIKLQIEPTNDDERLDQIAAFQIIRHVVGYLQLLLPYSFLSRTDFISEHSSIFHEIFKKTELNSSETVLMAQLYLAEITIDAQILTQFTDVTDFLPENLYLSSSSYMKNLLKYSWEIRGKFSHKQVILINNLVLSSEVQLEDIPFDKLLDCIGFEEERDRPIVESWLKFYDDEQRSQVAILAVFLLIRSGCRMTQHVLSTVETIWQNALFNKVDTIRQGARACFHSNPKMFILDWSLAMWLLLRNLMISSLKTCTSFLPLGTIDMMMNLLEAERQRLNMKNFDDLYSQFSLLNFIAEMFDNDGSDIRLHLVETLITEKSSSDLYIAYVIFHIVRKCQQKQWCSELFELLHELLYDITLSNTQLATVYALGSQEKGRKILLESLNNHFDGEKSLSESQLSLNNHFDGEKSLSESQLVACFLALTNSQDECTSIRSLNTDLWKFWDLIGKQSICVQRHFQACLFSHFRDENEQNSSKFQSQFDLTSQEMFHLYMINTSYFILEWREHGTWIFYAAEFIISHQTEVLTQFIDDLYSYLSTQNHKGYIFQNPKPNYLAVASILAQKNTDLFCQAIRRNSIYGEEGFRDIIYDFYKRGITIDQKDMCFRLYASFEILTEQFIEMIFDLYLQDFSIYQFDANQWCRRVKKANREDIETIFPYLQSPSMYQRQLAVDWLLYLVELDLISINEIHPLISDKRLWEMRNVNQKFDQFYAWDYLMCPQVLYHLKHFPVLHPDEVNADFSGVFDASYLQFT